MRCNIIYIPCCIIPVVMLLLLFPRPEVNHICTMYQSRNDTRGTWYANYWPDCRYADPARPIKHNRSFSLVSLVIKIKVRGIWAISSISRPYRVMAESSEESEVPLSDPQARHPRTWSESSAAGLADQLISPTSAGTGHSLETSGEFLNGLNFERCGVGGTKLYK